MTINTGSARLPTPSEFRIYVVIQHTPVNTKHNSLSLIKIHRKTLTWFTVSQCDVVCCSITAMPKAMRSSDNCNLQWGMRKGGGSGNKVNSSWFREAVTVNLFTLHVESFAHLDNTVNSNQDPGISNYRPWVEGRWGWGGMWWSDTCEQQFIHNIYSHCRDFIPECLLYYRDVHSRAQVFASNYPPNHWEQVAH